MKRISHSTRRICTICLLLLVCLTAPIVRAQTLDDLMAKPKGPPPERNGVIRLFDSVLVYPLPDWTPPDTHSNPLAGTRYNRQEAPGVFKLEMTPKNESAENWFNLYALLARQNYKGSTGSHAREIASAFRQNCNPSNLSIRPGRGDDNRAFLLIACGNYSKRPQLGEVAAFALFRRGGTAVRLYREWKGAAFRANDPTSWPVTLEEFGVVTQAMAKAKLLPRRQ